MALEVQDINVENSLKINGKTVQAETLRNISVDYPMVTSGISFSLAVDGNSRIERYLGGSNQTTTAYIKFKIPEDFVAFQSNAFSIDTRRQGVNPTTKVTWYKNGVVDSTINNLEHKATATNDTWETKTSTPGSTYVAGDNVLVKIVVKTNTGGGNFNAIDLINIKYLAK
jgi:hypothetical protein